MPSPNFIINVFLFIAVMVFCEIASVNLILENRFSWTHESKNHQFH